MRIVFFVLVVEVLKVVIIVVDDLVVVRVGVLIVFWLLELGWLRELC